MKFSKPFVLIVVAVLSISAAANAARVDMSDPRRALGREDDVRVDAQLLRESISAGSPIGVTYRIQNLTKSPVAVAEKRCEASYDADTQTVNVSIGAEVPVDGNMPRMAVIGPGEKKTFTVAAVLRLAVAGPRAARVAGPRFVQIKVNILRDLAPFQDLLGKQQQIAGTAGPIPLTDAQFDRWLEGNDAIFLNTIPVSFDPRKPEGVTAEASGRRPGGSF